MTATEASDAQSTYGLKQFKEIQIKHYYLFTLDVSMNDMSMNVPLSHDSGSL